jgi:hypothetical protein
VHIYLDKRNLHLKKAFDIRDVALVDQKQDHMVLGLDHGVVVGDEYVFATYHGPDGRARG